MTEQTTTKFCERHREAPPCSGCRAEKEMNLTRLVGKVAGSIPAAPHQTSGAHDRAEELVQQLRQEREILDQLAAKRAETIKSEREARELAEADRDAARETARELNRRNGELTKTLNKGAERKAWYGYYAAAMQLFKEEADKRERAEKALQHNGYFKKIALRVLASLKSSEGAK